MSKFPITGRARSKKKFRFKDGFWKSDTPFGALGYLATQRKVVALCDKFDGNPYLRNSIPATKSSFLVHNNSELVIISGAGARGVFNANYVEVLDRAYPDVKWLLSTEDFKNYRLVANVSTKEIVVLAPYHHSAFQNLEGIE